MVKFERKDTEKARLAIASLQKAKDKNFTYNTPEVNEALHDFCEKKIANKQMRKGIQILDKKV